MGVKEYLIYSRLEGQQIVMTKDCNSMEVKAYLFAAGGATDCYDQ